MIGILIISHNTLGQSLIECAVQMLNQPLPQLRYLGLDHQADPSALLPIARQAVADINSGAGVLILTDMYGGSPSNLCAQLVDAGHIEAVAGVNLPMLIRALTYREQSLALIVSKAISGGSEGVLRLFSPSTTVIHAATTR